MIDNSLNSSLGVILELFLNIDIFEPSDSYKKDSYKTKTLYLILGCPLIRCKIHCPYGFKKEMNGCPSCVCNDPPRKYIFQK